MSRPAADSNVTPPIEKEGNNASICRLLGGGWYASQVAKKLKISRKTVSIWAKFYVNKGILEPIGGFPKFYRRKKGNVTPPMATSPLLPILTPHHFGITFTIAGKPRVAKTNGIFTHKGRGYTFQICKYKAILWLTSLQGETPQEQIEWGRGHALELAELLGARYGCHFALLRYLPEIEWNLTDEGASKEMADKTGIKKDKPIEIAGAMFRFDDPSHPHQIEINKAFGSPPEIPTIHAQTLYFLLTQAPALMERQVKLLNNITDSIVVVNQKIETLAEIVKKVKP